MRINNLPNYSKDYRYIVAREWNGEFYFYGAFNDEEKAYDVATTVHGIVKEIFKKSSKSIDN